jgi:hypothetical protein
MSIRIRPKDGINAAFYAPSADITHAMRHVLSITLHGFDKRFEDKRHELMRLSAELAEFMRDAVLSDTKWDEDALPKLERLLEDLPRELAGEFLVRFFTVAMDYYWHAMRLTTESPEISPEAMAKALDMSALIRTMPPDMRAAYVDHARTFNMLPPVFESAGLFKEEMEKMTEYKTLKFKAPEETPGLDD